MYLRQSDSSSNSLTRVPPGSINHKAQNLLTFTMVNPRQCKPTNVRDTMNSDATFLLGMRYYEILMHFTLGRAQLEPWLMLLERLVLTESTSNGHTGELHYSGQLMLLMLDSYGPCPVRQLINKMLANMDNHITILFEYTSNTHYIKKNVGGRSTNKIKHKGITIDSVRKGD